MIATSRRVHDLIAASVARAPNAPAVVVGDRELTFAELDQQANRLAQHLTSLGAGPEVVVGISLPRSVEFVVAVVGVLKSGAAYLPIDPDEPPRRRRFIVDDADVLLTLTPERLSQDGDRIARQPSSPPDVSIDPANLAYVIYTSGSTGTPKGVMVTHGSATNYLDWAADHYAAGDGGALLHSPLNTDLSVTSLFVPLATGRPVHVLVGEEPVSQLPGALAEGGFDFVKLTPAHLDILTDTLAPEGASAATRLLVGGEALHFRQLDHWRRHAPNTVIVNEYGPTEATVACCAHELPAGDDGVGPVPIGDAIAGAELAVLDGNLAPVPDRGLGELYVGGIPVSRGYLGRPGLTAAAFLPDPHSERGGRMYRTGDLVRQDAARRLVYHGRADNQIKLRGHRIELGEVEAMARAHPEVRAAAVVLRDPDTDRAALVAHLVVTQRDAELPERVCEFLAQRLPAHMVPAEVRMHEAFPLTANGKVDRVRLVETTASALVRSERAPATELERAVAEIVADLLHADSVDTHRDFFTIGGNSLLAARLVARLMRAYQMDLPMTKWLNDPSVAGIAELIETYRTYGRVAALALGEAPEFDDLDVDAEIARSLQAG